MRSFTEAQETVSAMDLTSFSCEIYLPNPEVADVHQLCKAMKYVFRYSEVNYNKKTKFEGNNLDSLLTVKDTVLTNYDGDFVHLFEIKEHEHGFVEYVNVNWSVMTQSDSIVIKRVCGLHIELSIPSMQYMMLRIYSLGSYAKYVSSQSFIGRLWSKGFNIFSLNTFPRIETDSCENSPACHLDRVLQGLV